MSRVVCRVAEGEGVGDAATVGVTVRVGVSVRLAEGEAVRDGVTVRDALGSGVDVRVSVAAGGRVMVVEGEAVLVRVVVAGALGAVDVRVGATVVVRVGLGSAGVRLREESRVVCGVMEGLAAAPAEVWVRVLAFVAVAARVEVKVLVP